jgi:hypothetical protein
MDTVDKDYELMEKGIGALLGTLEYDAPEPVGEPCKHVSDGFVYDDNPVFVTLGCVKCHIQYNLSKLTGQEM